MKQQYMFSKKLSKQKFKKHLNLFLWAILKKILTEKYSNQEMDYHGNFNNYTAGNLNMSYGQCEQIAPKFTLKNVNDIYCSADDIFKRIGD